ncbi:MAG: hypothetical protein K6G69_11250 [Lachnospiraceae bacterium]|nr:hypothetical protein [Lachnospiraceae bacterium]
MSATAYKNRYNAAHYERVDLMLPKGSKERIRAAAAQAGLSMNDYLFRLVNADLGEDGKSRLASGHRFGEAEKEQLRKMQVAAKYYDMIECMSVDEEGYHITLRKGYTNSETGSRFLFTVTMKDMRLLITKSGKEHSERSESSPVCDLDYDTRQQLGKWQIPKKYYEMVESIRVSRKEGFDIYLKEGFINDHTGGRLIRVEKAGVFRSIMKYTHKEKTGS